MMEIAAALSGIKGAMDLAKAAIDARDDAKAKAAISDMASLLLEANMSALATSDEARKLSGLLDAATKELKELKEKQAERELYALEEIAKGRFVYASKTSGGPSHYICQNCLDKSGVKSVLRLNPGYDGFADEWVCANDKKHLITMDR